MLCFKVSLNGDVIHRASIEGMKVLSTRLSYATTPADSNVDVNMSLGSGGIDAEGNFLKWAGREDLGEGDEITIRIMELDESDQPELSNIISNEIGSEISAMLQKIKGLAPDQFGS